MRPNPRSLRLLQRGIVGGRVQFRERGFFPRLNFTVKSHNAAFF
jgi:hypothetical protein